MAVHLALCWAGVRDLSSRFPLGWPDQIFDWVCCTSNSRLLNISPSACSAASDEFKLYVCALGPTIIHATLHFAIICVYRHLTLGSRVCAIHREMEWVKGRRCEITLAMYALTRSHPISLFVQLTAIALWSYCNEKRRLSARGCNKFASANWGRLGEQLLRASSCRVRWFRQRSLCESALNFLQRYWIIQSFSAVL